MGLGIAAGDVLGANVTGLGRGLGDDGNAAEPAHRRPNKACQDGGDVMPQRCKQNDAANAKASDPSNTTGHDPK